MRPLQQGLGNALQVVGRLSAALEQFRRSVRLQPDLASAYNNIGACLLALAPPPASSRSLSPASSASSELREARSAFEWALMLNPSFPEAHYGMSSALIRLRQEGSGEEWAGDGQGGGQALLRAAARHLLTATRVSPGYAKAYHALGNLIAGTGRRRGAAEAALGFAVRLAPASADMCNSLAANLHLSARYRDALGWYTAALALQPDFAGAYFNAGNALQQLGRFAQAAHMLAAAAALQPASSRYRESYNAALAGSIDRVAGADADALDAAQEWSMPLVVVPGAELEGAVVQLLGLDWVEGGPVEGLEEGVEKGEKEEDRGGGQEAVGTKLDEGNGEEGEDGVEGDEESHRSGADSKILAGGVDAVYEGEASFSQMKGMGESVRTGHGGGAQGMRDAGIDIGAGGDEVREMGGFGMAEGSMIIMEDDEDESLNVGLHVVGEERDSCTDGSDEVHVEGEDYYEMYVPLEQ